VVRRRPKEKKGSGFIDGKMKGRPLKEKGTRGGLAARRLRRKGLKEKFVG